MDSDSGAASRSSMPTRAAGRLPCLSHSAWICGMSTHALNPSSCAGRRVKPNTLMYDDWFIQSGQRVCGPNLPLVAELRSKRHPEYSSRKEMYKCSKTGCLGRACPPPIRVVSSPNAIYTQGKGAYWRVRRSRKECPCRRNDVVATQTTTAQRPGAATPTQNQWGCRVTIPISIGLIARNLTVRMDRVAVHL